MVDTEFCSSEEKRPNSNAKGGTTLKQNCRFLNLTTSKIELSNENHRIENVGQLASNFRNDLHSNQSGSDDIPSRMRGTSYNTLLALMSKGPGNTFNFTRTVDTISIPSTTHHPSRHQLQTRPISPDRKCLNNRSTHNPKENRSRKFLSDCPLISNDLCPTYSIYSNERMSFDLNEDPIRPGNNSLTNAGKSSFNNNMSPDYLTNSSSFSTYNARSPDRIFFDEYYEFQQGLCDSYYKNNNMSPDPHCFNYPSKRNIYNTSPPVWYEDPISPDSVSLNNPSSCNTNDDVSQEFVSDPSHNDPLYSVSPDRVMLNNTSYSISDLARYCLPDYVVSDNPSWNIDNDISQDFLPNHPCLSSVLGPTYGKKRKLSDSLEIDGHMRGKRMKNGSNLLTEMSSSCDEGLEYSTLEAIWWQILHISRKKSGIMTITM